MQTTPVLCVLGLVGIGYYRGWHSSLYHYKSPDPPHPVETLEETMRHVEEGNPIDMMDVYSQLRHFCGDGAGDCATYLPLLPKVATSARLGPTTWAGKTLKKYNARAIDRLLTAIAEREDAAAYRAPLFELADRLVAALPGSLVKPDLKFVQRGRALSCSRRRADSHAVNRRL
eukprot:CAMPEP_0117547658 /NCGR_PEP_ID=MMETSP0784-20121206/47239_1 /TAXON_ID=39447 /ORGANISM="" /LENGTH=172 /DNA_ID=CAMNT_0005344573 /DNA_START=56 /DNA_END=570 /DNA_ORIENTATION=-